MNTNIGMDGRLSEKSSQKVDQRIMLIFASITSQQEWLNLQTECTELAENFREALDNLSTEVSGPTSIMIPNNMQKIIQNTIRNYLSYY